MSQDRSQVWAVVPAAGYGTRLRPHTHTRPKALVQVAGQPIIGHIIDQLELLEVSRIVLVVGYMGAPIVEYVQRRGCFSRVESVQQEELLGLGHAIYLTRDVVGADPMLMVYGDTVFRADLDAVLRASADGMVGVKTVDDPSRFGVVVEEGGRVRQLLEKPEHFVSDRAIVGVNLISASELLFSCLEELISGEVRTRGEFQLTDALQGMVDHGAALGTFPVEEWFDCGTQEALLETDRHLHESTPVPAHATDSVVVPPVHIDPSATVAQSVVGPYVSIGAGAEVNRSVIRNSIIGEEAVVENAMLEDSLVGFQAVVRGRPSRLNVGDLSEIVG